MERTNKNITYIAGNALAYLDKHNPYPNGYYMYYKNQSLSEWGYDENYQTSEADIKFRLVFH